MEKFFEYLLSDENQGISLHELEERKLLVNELEKIIGGKSLGKIRHFQPQIGCLNACSICSKHARANVAWWNDKRQRNVIAAIKHVALKYRNEKPYISWDRENHRSGVIFSYLDNDIGNYYYLNEFINLMYDELGVGTRISTVGYSRYNEYLNEMHRKINEADNLKKLAGFRVSFTPYAIGWKCNNKNYNRLDYILDMANILKIYKPYYEYVGSGSRNMCVELRYKPLVLLEKVYTEEIEGHMVIACNNHIYISKETNISLKTSFIANPYEHKIVLSKKPILFYDLNCYTTLKSFADLKEKVVRFLDNIENYKSSDVVQVFQLENADGHYYTINPSISEKGNYGVNIYPTTANRVNSGIVVTERFVLNAIFKVKKQYGLYSLQKFNNATWINVYEVLDELSSIAREYVKIGEKFKSDYILSEIIPMIDAYIYALQLAGYKPSDFFDPDFTIDTGIICNMGGALKEFKGITFLENEPLTPTHERNYGKHNSTMTEEKEAFRISCEYGDAIVVQKLNLSKTATREGQVEFSKTIYLEKTDEIYNMESLENEYLIPGQRRK